MSSVLLQNPHIKDIFIECDCSCEIMRFYKDEDLTLDKPETFIGIQYFRSLPKAKSKVPYNLEFEDLHYFKEFVNHLKIIYDLPFSKSLRLISSLKDNYVLITGLDDDFVSFQITKRKDIYKDKKILIEILIDKNNLKNLVEEFNQWQW